MLTIHPSKVAALPTAKVVHDIALAMEEVKGDVKGVRADIAGMKETQRETIRAVERQVGLIMQHNMGGKRG